MIKRTRDTPGARSQPDIEKQWKGNMQKFALGQRVEKEKQVKLQELARNEHKIRPSVHN